MRSKLPARRPSPYSIGEKLGVFRVTSAAFARKASGRNRYFRTVECTSCGVVRTEREDGLKRLEGCGCAKCGAYPEGLSVNISVTREWKGQSQTYERARFHGGSYDPLHGVWSNMRERCNNPRSEKWRHYGGRGITVCEEWSDYVTFRDWALSNGYEPGLELDRLDNDRAYEPNNCMFRTNLDNLLNRGSYLSHELDARLQSAARGTGLDRYEIVQRAVRALRDGEIAL